MTDSDWPNSDSPTVGQRLLAEFTGSMFLLIGVIGSGIMAERLSDDPGLQLLQNALATAGILVALILTFGWVSGAHFNPAVTLASRLLGEIPTPMALMYMGSQFAGGIAGAGTANMMFDLRIFTLSTTNRSGGNLALSEVVATVGLLVVVWGVARSGHSGAVAYAVAAYIGGAYYFTSSTSFANPAVTVARTLSDTFAGIEPSSAPYFILAQLFGVCIAVLIIRTAFASRSDGW